jgi:hypothetical protein
LTVPGFGSRLIGGSLQAELTREDAVEVLVDGFLPRVPADATPARAGSGFREFGLPYAADAGITRYLAEFLSRHADRAPDAVLLNGGFFESSALRDRLLDVVAGWMDGDRPPRALRNDRLDMAVARGAAYYGQVRRGRGTRIASGLPRAYYVGVGDAQGKLSAVCVAPSGLEEGEGVEAAGHVFDLLLREPVEFPLFASTLRTRDKPGDVVEIDALHLSALPPMRTVLRTSRKASRSTVAVSLYCRATEIGTFEIWCRETDGDRQWQLQFDLRAQGGVREPTATPSTIGATTEERVVADCARAVAEAFGGGADALAALPRRLEEAAGMPRAEWPPLLLRRVWDALMEHRDRRMATPAHESRWLNLVGFCLRPGFGVALDDWRVEELWKLFPQGVAHPKNELCRAEWWILWRRVAGGLAEGRQTALAEPLVRRLKAGKGSFGCGKHESAELWRLLACLERLAPDVRRALGGRLSERLARKGWGSDQGAAAWALGRIAARVPLYGPLNHVVDPEIVAGWLDALLALDAPREEQLFEVALMVRRTGDRYRDVSDEVRGRVLEWLRRWDAPAHTVALVAEGGELDEAEAAAASGDTLPMGLRWPSPSGG